MNVLQPATNKHYLELFGFGKTHRSFGGGTWSFVADIISEELPSFGSAVDTIYVTLFCNGSLEEDHRNLPALNDTESVKFYRKKKRIDICYPSHRFTPDEEFGTFLINLERTSFAPAVDDLIDALSWGLRARITKKDDFDTTAFLAWVARFRTAEFSTDEAFRAAARRAIESKNMRNGQNDPWEQLDIEWEEMHPKARTILDDPVDWSCAYEFSPHGNDTGADILSDWGDYNDMSPQQAALQLGWDASELDTRNELFRIDWVKIHFALAFGQIKFSGACSPVLARNAKEVIGAEVERRSEFNEWPHREEFVLRMNRYLGILEQFI